MCILANIVTGEKREKVGKQALFHQKNILVSL